MTKIVTSPRIWFIACTAVILTIVAGVSIKPAYRALKVWRAQTLAQNVEENMQTDRFLDSVTKILAAEKLAGTDPYVMRVKGKLYNKIRHPRSDEIWSELVRIEPHNFENWEGLFYAAMIIHDPKLAFMATIGLEKVAPDKRMLLNQLEFEFLLSAKQTERAIQKADQLLEYFKIPDRIRLLVCDFFLQLNDTDRNELARNWLLQRGKEKDSISLACLITLSKDKALASKTASELSNLLHNHPLKTTEADILATAIRLRDETDSSKITAAWKAFGKEKPLTERSKFARWLDEHGNQQAAEALVSKKDALLNRDAALVVLNTQGSKGKWDEMKTLLDDPDLPISEPLKLLYTSRISYETNDQPFFNIYWEQALSAAKKKPEILGYFANYASVLEWNKKAIEACREMTKLTDFEKDGWIGLYNIAKKTGDSELANESLANLTDS